MAAPKAITPGPGGSGEEAPSSVVPHLVDGVVSEILRRLPTKDAYRLSAVCRRWREIISEPAFLSQHLSPRPLPLLNGGPDALILQPRRKIGYTRLTLVATDPANNPNQAVIGGAVSSLDQAAEAPQLAATVEVGEGEDFFQRTVPMLDISFVAGHGRLLLARSRTRHYICDPAANRWLVLPPSALPPTAETASGLHYDLDAATGRVSFTVVLLVRARGRRVRAETFSSATGRWDTAYVPGAQGAARRLAVASPGIHVGASFYWLCRDRGHAVRYDVARGRASVVCDPPEAEDSKGRVWRSLGSAGRRLRMCAFDIRDEESGNMLPHDDLEGVHGVWAMDAAAGAWRHVHEAVVEGLATYYFHMLFGHEKALDFAGACGDYIFVVDSDDALVRYHLDSGDKVELARRIRIDGGFHVFPFYISSD